MDAAKLAGMAVAAAMLCVVVRRQEPELAGICAAAAGAVLLLAALESVGSLRQSFERIAALSGLQTGYLSVLLKALAIACGTELAAQTCADLGENGLAAKVSLCGRLMIFALASPMLMSLLEMILALTP